MCMSVSPFKVFKFILPKLYPHKAGKGVIKLQKKTSVKILQTTVSRAVLVTCQFEDF